MRIGLPAYREDARYQHLVPIVSLLREHGNELAVDYGAHYADDSGFSIDKYSWHCLLVRPLDFDLVERTFTLAEHVRFERAEDAIRCARSGTAILGNRR